MFLSLIIRPPRSTYQNNTGTQQSHNLGGKNALINNFSVTNAKG